MLGNEISTPATLTTRTLLTDALAGGLTAAVFYAEYTGLGALLGAVLPGQKSAAQGSLMVIGAVVISSLLALAVRQPFIAGPRAASLAVLIVGMKFATEHAAAQEGRFFVAMAALATMQVAASATLLLGLVPSVQRIIDSSHIALRKGFVFATAVGIVVGLGAVQLDGCLRVNPLMTTAIAVVSIWVALAWARSCRRAEFKRPWQFKLVPLSMMLGVGVATLGYYMFLVQTARDGLCGTLGIVGLKLDQLKVLVVMPSTFVVAAAYLPLWVWLMLAVIGVLQGGVLLLESMTTLSDRKDPAGTGFWAAQLKLRAFVNLLCAPFGFASSSLSASRTSALLQAHGKTRLAVLFHGLGLLAILVFCSAWIAKLPVIAVAVALVLVAAQMIDDDTRNEVWRDGYASTATNASMGVTWLFWCVLGLSVLAGSVLRYFDHGFGGGPLIALVLGAMAMAAFAGTSDKRPKNSV